MEREECMFDWTTMLNSDVFGGESFGFAAPLIDLPSERKGDDESEKAEKAAAVQVGETQESVAKREAREAEDRFIESLLCHEPDPWAATEDDDTSSLAASDPQSTENCTSPQRGAGAAEEKPQIAVRMAAAPVRVYMINPVQAPMQVVPASEPAWVEKRPLPPLPGAKKPKNGKRPPLAPRTLCAYGCTRSRLLAIASRLLATQGHSRLNALLGVK